MPTDAAVPDRRVERGLTLAAAAAAAVALGGVGQALGSGHRLQGVAGLVLLAALVAAWWQRSRRGSGPATTVVLAALVLALTLLPDAGALGVLLLLMVPMVAALDLGFRVGVVVAVVYAVAFTVQVFAFLDGSSPGDVLLENALVLVLLVLAAGLGSLVRATERARAEAATAGAELAAANLELRRSLALERELVLAEERARSAAELHDGLGHRLTLVSMALDFAQRVRERDPERAWAEVGTAADTTRTALAEMRLWVRALAPPAAVEGVGGAAAFEAIAAAFRGTGLDVRVSHRGDERSLPQDVALFATRFVQEGLTNVLRHAGAGRVDLAVQQSPAQLRLSIADDGGGPGADPGEGFGRRSLRERAELLGGRIDVGRSELGGFELTAVVPLGEDR